MELVRRLSIPASLRLSFDPGALAAWFIPFVLLLYLGASNGGYDLIERSEVGIGVWWVVTIGAAAGAIWMPRRRTAASLALLLLLAFAGWNALSLSWTGSAERTTIELGRVSMLIGVFVLAISQQSSRYWRTALGGVTSAAVTLVALAALSRMLPELFPTQTAGEFFPGLELESRLAYPLNYSTGLAALSALSLPLLLRVAADSRWIAIRAGAAAMLPICVLVLWLTGSSLAIPLAAIAVTAYLLLTADRAPQLVTLLISGAGGALLVAAAAQRDALDRGGEGAAAVSQGQDLLLVAVVVGLGVALMQVAIGLLARHANRPAWSRSSRSRIAVAGACVVAAGALVFAFSSGPAAVEEAWDEFRSPTSGLDPSTPSRSAQILDVSSNGRYRFWQTAVDAFEEKPLTGIGPGTFEFYWAEQRDDSLFVRDAHSLWLEVLSELGLPGLILILSFTVVALLAAARRALDGLDEGARMGIAAATAAAATFAAAATVDWMWELGALAAIFVALLGIALSIGDTTERHRPSWPSRLMLTGAALIGLLAVAIPLAGGEAVARSQAAASNGETASAIDAAEDGLAVQPYAASPALQRALLLEGTGEFEAAAQQAREATSNEPSNWRNWVILSRLEARAGDAQAAVEAYRQASALNPRSELFER